MSEEAIVSDDFTRSVMKFDVVCSIMKNNKVPACHKPSVP